MYIDGASKGNPGPSGIGAVICENGEVIKNLSTYIGTTTNNVAEYTALLYALQEAMVLKADELTIYTDSQLLYRQLKKIYKIKSENIIGLYTQSVRLLEAFKKVTLHNIPREKNRGADALATKAVRAQCRSLN
ncbi:MAG: ribonuclease HI family protein [Candidatus Omnitrophica bacterium]|nr:ribonuclease HI family protein [Candidatus Omnitrophota bacterium]